MPLSKSELEALVRLVGLTKDAEMDCQQCLALVAEFAERKLAGKSLPDALAAVDHHLAVCSECREEYEALQAALKGLDG